MKRALITGITGQDGSYLADLLLEKGYEVHGIVRRSSSLNRARIDHLRAWEMGDKQRLFLHYGDLADSVSLVKLLYELQPDEIYNLAAQSHVRVSFDIPEYTADITGVGAGRILEAIRESGIGKKVRFYQASSSEMFGKVQEVPQTERTPLYPRSPYACAKVMAHYLTINYRESYSLFACSGILFNHESPRRGEAFVTRKITLAAARIKVGLQKKLVLGNIDSKRDWGFAKEYVEGMWRMLQQDQPDDYVLATNETHTVKEFLDATFGALGLDWKEHVEFDPRFLRPAEVDLLIGDYSKAQRQLGWEPQTRMAGLAKLMVEHDLALAQRELRARQNLSVTMNVSVVIPARLASTRLPRKVLADLGRAVLRHIWERVARMRRATEILVATDSEEVAAAVAGWGGQFVMTSPACRSGTERIASILDGLHGQFILNVQGDEPFIDPALLDALVDRFATTGGDVVTPVYRIRDYAALINPAVVKVVRGADGRAWYFSRSPIPHLRGLPIEQWPARGLHWGHLGVYGYARARLAAYATLPESPLENAEALEQLRFLEADWRIQTVETDYHAVAIDTPEDLARARALLAAPVN